MDRLRPALLIAARSWWRSLKSGSLVNTLSARFRHYNIKLLLFSTQVFRYVSNVVRQNCTDLIVGSPFPNRKELLKIASLSIELSPSPILAVKDCPPSLANAVKGLPDTEMTRA
jgi:hypothetical protein